MKNFPEIETGLENKPEKKVEVKSDLTAEVNEEIQNRLHGEKSLMMYISTRDFPNAAPKALLFVLNRMIEQAKKETPEKLNYISYLNGSKDLVESESKK